MNKQIFYYLVGGIISLAIGLGISRFAYTGILPMMQNDLGFSETFAGYLAGSNFLGYLIGAILVTLLPLQQHRVLYFRIGLIVSVITTFMMGLTHSFILLMLIRLFAGISSAFILILSSSIVLDRLAQENKTNLGGYFYSGVGVGIFLSAILIPKLNHSFHWEGAWIGLAIISFAIMIFSLIWIKEFTNKETKLEVQKSTIKTPPRNWLPFLTIAYGLEGLCYIVTGTFLVSIAEQSNIFSDGGPAIVWMFVGIAAIPSCVIWSEIAKRWGYVKTIFLSMVLQAFGIALPVIWLTPISFIICAILFGGTFMGIATLITTLGREISPVNSSRVIGALTFSLAAGQMIGPVVAGMLNDFTGSYHTSLLGAASVVFVGSLFLVSGIKYEKPTNVEVSPYKISR